MITHNWQSQGENTGKYSFLCSTKLSSTAMSQNLALLFNPFLGPHYKYICQWTNSIIFLSLNDLMYPFLCWVLRLNQSKDYPEKILHLFLLILHLFSSLFLFHLDMKIFISFFSLNNCVQRLIHSFHLSFFNKSLCEFPVLTFYFR